MKKMLVVPAVAGLVLSFAVPALAQSSGSMLCEMDLKRIDELYREKQYVLTDEEREDAMKLRQAAQNKCLQGGEQMGARSKEARALLDKLENAPAPSQAQIPRSR